MGRTNSNNRYIKKGTHFVKATEIQAVAERIFSRLRDNNYYCSLPKDTFVEELTDFYCATNMLHPFRKGNGRTQRLFISLMVRNAGYEINFSDADKDELMIATIYAANGVTDVLKNIFKKIIQ